jgi:hypothetical protein
MCSFKSAWDAVASPFGTRASVHPPSLVQGRGKYRLSRWHPNGSRPGIATIFRIARAIQSTGEDAWDQLSPKPSGDEKTKSFGEGERPRWSTSAGSGSLRDQTTKRRVEPCAPDPGKCELYSMGGPRCLSMGRKHQTFGTCVVELRKACLYGTVSGRWPTLGFDLPTWLRRITRDLNTSLLWYPRYHGAA